MRVVCETCAAAYAVEDGLIGPRGAKAQCPRCRHVQHVAAPEGAAPPAPAAAGPGCIVCGAELADAFDQAMGTCDACRQSAPPPAEAAPSKPSNSGNFAYLLEEAASAPEPAQGADLPSVSVDPALAQTEVLPDYADVEAAAAKAAPPAPPPVALADPHDEYLARSAPLKLVE